MGVNLMGPQSSFILREDTLIELEEILPESASPLITYLRSIRALHELCTARVLEDHSLVLYHIAKLSSRWLV